MAVSVHVGKEDQTNIWDGGVAPLKASYGKLMMWFFLLSDAFTFSGLLITYGFLRYSFPAFNGSLSAFKPSPEYWPIPEKIFDAVPFLHGVHLPLLFVGIMTFVLILSSVTMVLAVEAGQLYVEERKITLVPAVTPVPYQVRKHAGVFFCVP